MKKIRIKTKRLVLTPMEDARIGELSRTAEDAHLRAAYGEMLAGCAAHPKERLWYAPWEIALRDGTPVGDLGFKGAPCGGAVELGYGVAEEHRCRGYATEACAALIEWAFGQEDVLFVDAETDAENETSQRVLQKLGFHPCGTGEEGPRFEKEKPASSWMAVYMCLGMSVGMCFGASNDNLALGMSLGVTVGVAVGLLLDAADKKKRAAVRARRTGAPEPEAPQE